MSERLLTAREVVGLSTESVLHRWRAGEIPGFRIASNVLRFDPAEVEAWREKCRTVSVGWALVYLWHVVFGLGQTVFVAFEGFAELVRVVCRRRLLPAVLPRDLEL